MAPIASALGSALRLALAGACLALGTSCSERVQVLRLPVSFEVINRNTSAVQTRCSADNQPYTVHGTLVGPRAALGSAEPGAVTQYLHGFDNGWHHRFPVFGYDWGDEMARLGHTSLMVDMLGYGASGRPPGNLVCLGSQADVADQIDGMLRSGRYSLDGGVDNGLRFQRVLLAGHDVAGGMVELAAYSFGGIDGLILMSWSDAFLDWPYLSEFIVKANETCQLNGGEDPDTGEAGGQYMFFGPQPDSRYRQELFFDADPVVLDEVIAHRTRNPCGYLGSIIPTMQTDVLRAREIEVPVLMVYSEDDPVIPEQGALTQEQLFSGSPDVHVEVQPDSGHFPWFERNVMEYRGRVSDWLCSRGFGHPDVPCRSQLGAAHGSGASGSSSFDFGVEPLAGGWAPTGSLSYRDHATGLELAATSFDTLAIVDGPCGPGSRATLRGLARVDGAEGQAFEAGVDDCGASGASDGFWLRIDGPDVSYEASGELLEGDVDVQW